jgi:hypothetical protein
MGLSADSRVAPLSCEQPVPAPVMFLAPQAAPSQGGPQGAPLQWGMFPPGVALPGAPGPSAGSFVPIAYQSGQSPPLATYHVGYTPEAQ